MKLITVKELSEYLSVKESTLYSWAEQGKIPCHKLNRLLRFDLDEIIEWVESSRDKKQAPKLKAKGNAVHLDINTLINNAIESEKKKGYNSSQREARPKSRKGE